MTKRTKKDIGAILRGDGVDFRVWAPFANSVAVSGSFNNWSISDMQSEDDGYWFCHIKNAEAGQEYKYVIRNGDNTSYKNDPRSLRVTTNDGNSVIVDSNYIWSDQNFVIAPLETQIIYEMHIGTFHRIDPSTGGTFSSAAEKLDYLSELGVNVIELMPVTSMSMDRGWGYATDYIYAVESLYGGQYQLKEFINNAHKKGIAVILDVVYNHFGPDPSLDLWCFDGWSENGKGGIYFYNDWRSQTPWGDTRPDFGRKEVRQYITDNIKLWLIDCHFDGLRVDSTIFIRNVKGQNDDPGNDLPDGWSLLQEITNIAKKIKPQSITIAEDIGYNSFITKDTKDGGAGFTAQWETGFPNALREALDTTEDNFRNLSNICKMLDVSYNNSAFQRVIYSDSHDSAANGAARLSEEITPGNPSSLYSRKRSLIAAAIVLTARGIPMLLQGQEFMTGGSFNDWNALDWDRVIKFSGIVEAHKHLIALRKNYYDNTKGLQGQSFTILHLNDESKILAYHRWDQGGIGDDVVVVINFKNLEQKDYVINFPRQGIWKLRFNSDWKGYSEDFKNTPSSDAEVIDNRSAISIGPYSVLIYSQ